MTTLEQIAETTTAEPIELPRLTVANTFITYNRLMDQLRNAAEAGQKLPTCNLPLESVEALKAIVRASEAVIKYAGRLIEASK